MAAALPFSAAAQPIPEPDAYRVDEYRSPVPLTLSGATVVDDDAAYALWKTGRVAFIDVLPRPPKPQKLPEGTVWIEKSRNSIPGAIWLPNTGYGELADQTMTYLTEGLSEATGGDHDAPVLFFCLRDCWMSWNAAKRALEIGYTNVFWYPDGTDGWEFMEYQVDKVLPRPE